MKPMTVWELERALLHDVDIDDAKQFADTINAAIPLLHLRIVDFCREFGASRITVQRWVSGANAPHPLIRGAVYAWLLEKCK